MALSEKEFKERVERWQQAEPGVLASFFHQLINEDASTGLNYQFLKARIFYLNGLDDLQKHEVQSMNIWMGLRAFHPDSVNFEPLLEVIDDKGKSHYYDCADNTLNFGQTEPVPTPFVDNTSRLWLDQQSDQLPDMFTTTGKAGIQRVRFFRVEGTGLSIIKNLLPSAVAFNIIPGLDYNKLANPDDTVFIPIINIKVPELNVLSINSISNDHLHGVGWSIVEDGDDDTFFDFSRPCPPTCPGD